jgi:endonuclease/exonuclease/phosphatase family metal-dependent hydrolase
MKMRYLILCALFLISGIQIYAQSELTVITFNIKSFEGDAEQGTFDVYPYANHLRDHDADFIMLNEVENRSSRMMVNGKYRDVVQELANQLNMFAIFGYSYNLSNKDGKQPEENYTYCENELYGNAILSKYPILSSNAIQLPRPAGSADQRGVLTVDVLLPSKKVIRVAVTHLDHISGQKEQSDVLISDKVLDDSKPVILTGDMNQGIYGDAIQNIETVYDRLDNDNGTFGGSKLDYIFGSKGKWEKVSCEVLSNYYNGMYLSDHNPVKSVIRLK